MERHNRPYRTMEGMPWHRTARWILWLGTLMITTAQHNQVSAVAIDPPLFAADGSRGPPLITIDEASSVLVSPASPAHQQLVVSSIRVTPPDSPALQSAAASTSLESLRSAVASIKRSTTSKDKCNCNTGLNSLTVWPTWGEAINNQTISARSYNQTLNFSQPTSSIHWICDGMTDTQTTTLSESGKEWLVSFSVQDKICWVVVPTPSGSIEWSVVPTSASTYCSWKWSSIFPCSISNLQCR